MEFGNTYLDDEEIQMEQGNQNVGEQQYILHDAPQLDQEDPHHGVVGEEELLAAQAAADAAVAQQQEHGTPGGVFNNVGQGLVGKNRDMMMQYWQEIINLIEHDEHDFKNHQLPLARIKKVMKTDEDVRMISAEAPILFAKGCDVFITELTMRAWIHAEENKRRTLQKSDIAAALTKSDMFDFLIDVVPREEERPKKAYRDPGYPPLLLNPMRHGMPQPRSHLQNNHLPNPPSHLQNANVQNNLQNAHLPENQLPAGHAPGLDKIGRMPEEINHHRQLPHPEGLPQGRDNAQSFAQSLHNEQGESDGKGKKEIDGEQKDGAFFEPYQLYENGY